MGGLSGLFIRWFDKLVFGLTVGAIVLSVVWRDAGSDAAASELESLLERVETAARSQELLAGEPLQFTAQARQQIDAVSVPAAQPFPSWIMHRRPYLLVKIDVPLDRPPSRHGHPEGVSVSVSRSGITVRWLESPQNELVKVEGYELHRRKGTSGQWQSIAKTDADGFELVDRSAPQSVDVWYRVSSQAHEDAEDASKPLPLSADRQRLISEPSGPHRVPGRLLVVPDYVEIPDPVSQPGRSRWARISIYAWDGSRDQWDRGASSVVTPGARLDDLGAQVVDLGLRHETVVRLGVRYVRELGWVEIRFDDGREERFDVGTLPQSVGGHRY